MTGFVEQVLLYNMSQLIVTKLMSPTVMIKSMPTTCYIIKSVLYCSNFSCYAGFGSCQAELIEVYES